MRHREALELVQDHTASDSRKESPSPSLTVSHTGPPFPAFPEGPCLHSWGHLYSPRPRESPGDPPLLVRLAAQRSPAPCIGHRALGHGVGGEGFRVQPDSFLPSKAGKGNQPKTQAI